METFIIIISIMVGALIGALITALVLQNKNGKVAAQVSVLASQLKTEEEKAAAPEGMVTNKALGKGFEGYSYRIQVDPVDCQGCSSCANVCMAKNKALVMEPLESQMHEQPNWDYLISLPEKKNPMNKFTVKGSQFERPLYEFNGSCAGCGEAPYMKLMTQLFGERMYIADATGCTYVVGSSTPAFPYAKTAKGYGPAPSNSLFENNAEYGMGMYLSVAQMRRQAKMHAEAALKATEDEALKAALAAWLEKGDDPAETRAVSEALKDSSGEKTTSIYDRYKSVEPSAENAPSENAPAETTADTSAADAGNFQ